MADTEQNSINALGFASMAKEMQANFKQVEELMAGFTQSYEGMNLDPFNMKQAYSDWWEAVAKNPQKVMEANMAFWQKSLELTQQAMFGFMGADTAPVIETPKSDRRFSHEDWANKPIFDVIKQSYLLTSDWMRKVVASAEGLDEHTSERVKFFTERMLDAMSPTNFALTNPAVIEKIRETKGANLVHGLKNMLEDLEAGKGQLKIRMTDASAFELGKNVAATPGKVVFQNRMFQLLEYTPTTEQVLKRPLLIVPPWINKFYIMDLQPKNSLLKWLVDQGHTVYVISWVNPDETYAETGFEDYITDGVLKALDAIQYDTGESEINAIGYCIGGTLLASSLAYMQATGDTRIKSATFFTTMLNFANPGELGLFIDDEQIKGLEGKMQETGYLDGSTMAGTFNLLRANDLIWSFYINNYLLGNDPRPFDLLYWNSDSTRMPAKMHSWYLRNLYLNNQLCQPKALNVHGVPLDLTSIDIPACFISAVEDHIAPWQSTYSGARMFGGKTRFILGGSGHIAGIINPPGANKYNYRVTDELPEDGEAWAKQAAVNAGSWWPEWDRWVRALDNAQVPARVPGQGKLAAIEDAPGTYVKSKLGEATPILAPTVIPEAASIIEVEPAPAVADTHAEATPVETTPSVETPAESAAPVAKPAKRVTKPKTPKA
ncbi:MAG: class I poly(R)-hydroxyalkanoic acid synthase [Thiotrichaceae bacterium]|uniref:Class I poly(R)-hydroxyalkanoic acid synthase n=1 Tax=Candidatus Thiocaldithrix dubininis TaxID=3080823 RepID=A0AA95H886_9GAMM|nr:MAG: class I poly(R)-hydroxyalkanoic acid synthase [Candidatus Thiocaldithrix dubininis]